MSRGLVGIFRFRWERESLCLHKGVIVYTPRFAYPLVVLATNKSLKGTVAATDLGVNASM